MTNAQNNVKYGKFTVEELFNVKGTKSTDAGKVHFVGKQDGDAQFIGRTNANYGLQGYVNSKDFAFEPNKANTISVSQVGTITAQYRDFPYYTSQNITKLSADFLNRQIGLYICSAINQWLRGAQFEGYHTLKMADLKKQQLILPVTPSGTPDFEYMEERIRELEEERIRELDAYLKVTGLSDATLTKADQDALDKMSNGEVKWKKFKIGDLFERTSLPRKIKQFKKKRDVSTEMTQDFNLPLVNSKVGNNGIMYYGKSEQWNAAKLTIDIIQDGAVGAGMVYAQPDSTGVLYNAYLINWKNNQEPINAKHILFFASSLRKVLYGAYNYQRKATWDRVQDDFISLPITSSGDIDFDFMENYITAIEKQSICGVIEYKDKMIQTTKDVVNAN